MLTLLSHCFQMKPRESGMAWSWQFSTGLKLRRNHLEILLKCRSWCRRWRVVLTFCISNRLLGDTDTAVFQPELSEPKVWDTEQRMILAWIPLPPHCLVLFTTGDIIINPFVARTKAIIYIENLQWNPFKTDGFHFFLERLKYLAKIR